MTRPTISVIIPAHNCEQYIGQALDSVYAQICRPDEVIVVDDGSTDRTASVVESYCFTEDRFRSYLSFVGKISPNPLSGDFRPDAKPVELILLRQENCGPSTARNRGIKQSRGEWTFFLDADDVWLPATVCSLLKLLRDYPQSAVVFGNGLNFVENGKAPERIYNHPGEFAKGIIDEAFDYILKKNAIMTGAILASKELILTVNGFREDISHGEDHDLWLKLVLFAQLACTDEVVLLRRRRSGALSGNQAAFYKAVPLILSDIKRTYSGVLARRGIDICKSIVDARYKLAYFYYLHRMPLKAIFAAMRLAGAWLAYLPRRQKVSNTRRVKQDDQVLPT